MGFLLLLWLFGCFAVAGQGNPAGEARVHLERGAAHLQRNEKDAAVRELRRAVALDPRSAAAHMVLGQAYLAQGALEMLAEARGEFQQALELDPNLVWARFYLAKSYFDLGRYEKARAELERCLAERPRTAHFFALLGEVERKLGAAERGAELERLALDADPAMTPAHYYLSLAYLDLGREDEALRELEQAVRSKFVIPEIYIALGSIYTRRQNLKGAAEAIGKAIDLDPARPEGHLELARVCRLEKRYDRALDELRAAAPEGKKFLGTPYYQRVMADVAFETGRIYQDQDQGDRALEAYGRALEIDPDHTNTHHQLAELYLARGEKDRARYHAERAARPQPK